jgi:putrescine importer
MVYQGFINSVGRAMFLDYLLQPLINTFGSPQRSTSVTLRDPYLGWAAIIAGNLTLLNLVGVRSSARMNPVLLLAMIVVMGFFVVLAVRYLFLGQGWPGLLPGNRFTIAPPSTRGGFGRQPHLQH